MGLQQRLRIGFGDWGLRFVIEIIGNGDLDGGLGLGLGLEIGIRDWD